MHTNHNEVVLISFHRSSHTSILIAYAPPSPSPTLMLTKERQRLPLFVASRHQALSRFLRALPFSFRFPSDGRIELIPELFVRRMKQLSREQAEKHLTISNIVLFSCSLLADEGPCDIYGRLLRRLKTSLPGKVSPHLRMF